MKNQTLNFKVDGYEVEVYQTEWLDYFDEVQINLCVSFSLNGEEVHTIHAGHCQKFLTKEEAEQLCRAMIENFGFKEHLA